MKNAAIALVLSLGFHFALGAVFAFGLMASDAPEVSVRLDLSNVELSFAPDEDESAAPVAAASASEVAPQKPAPKPPPVEDVVVAEIAPAALPPDAPPAELRDPEETPPQVETPPSPPPAPSSEARPAPRQAKVDAPPRLRRNIRPVYPEGARERGESGAVTLEILVGADGTVADVSVAASSWFAALDEAALKAARRARFVPAESGGRPVASRARLTLDYKLSDR